MTDQQIQQIPIRGILPQQDPFVMVDQLHHFDELVTKTRFKIESDNIFCHNGHFATSGLVENIAQTCAARIGYINKYILHKDVNIGFIGAIRNLEIYRCPEVGQTIETSIEILNDAFGLTLAHGKVCLTDGTVVAEGEMKIALSEKSV